MRALNEHVDKLNAMIGACCDEGLTQEMRSAVSAAQAKKASIYAEPSQGIKWRKNWSRDLSRQRERFHKRLSDKAGAGAGAGVGAAAAAAAQEAAAAATAEAKPRMPVLTMQRLRPLFHLDRQDAADQLSVGMTYFKQQCRENGIERWPESKSKPAPSLRSVAHWVGDCLQER